MIVKDSELGLDYTTLIELNETASFLVSHFNQGQKFTKEEWILLLLDQYDVDRDTAAKDVDALITTLSDLGIIER